MKLKDANILVIDDDADVLTAVKLLLKPEVKVIEVENNPERIPERLRKTDFNLVLLDMNFQSSVNTGNEGLFWLKRIRELRGGLPVVLITAYGDVDLAVRSLKEGASDFILKPWSNERLLETITEILDGEKKVLKRSGQQIEIVGISDAVLNMIRKMEKVAPTDANILILGENGTGKDLVAKYIYQESKRAKMPFVKVDVGALSESLFESELFGHKKGAFTDAREDRVGLIESANGGTLFLDEIGNIPLHLQAKLLTVIQNREVMRLGSNESVPVDIRLITATNLTLSDLADEGRFRKDLIYRINTVEVIVPPLRDRGNDIILLAEYFLKLYGQRYSKHNIALSQDAKNKLLSYDYPGNVRELQSAIERAVIMSDSSMITSGDILFSQIERITLRREADEIGSSNLEEIEMDTIKRVLEKYNWNISQAAKELGLTRTSLYRRMEKYGL